MPSARSFVGPAILPWLVLAASAALVPCGRAFGADASGDDGRTVTCLGTYRITLYWIVEEADLRYRGAPGRIPILDPRGKVIKRVSRLFKRDLDMEGTGRLSDGRTVNFHSRRGASKRFIVTSSPYGLAADGRALVPFRSAAADRKRIPAGALLYVPHLKGMKLPDGGTHGGVIVAHDTGQAIKGRRLDLFIGPRTARERVEQTGVTADAGVRVYLLPPVSH